MFVASMFVPEATFLEVISGMGRIWDGGVVGSAPRELAEGYFRIWELASMLNFPTCARSFHVKGQECKPHDPKP